MRMHRLAGAFLALASLALAVSCHKSDDETGPSTNGTTDGFIAGVSVAGTAGTYTALTPPAASGGPLVTLGGNAVVVNGGTNQISVTSTTALAKVYVFVSGLTGYYDVPVPAPGTSATLVISIAQSPSGSSFTLGVAGVSSTGAVGATTTIPTTVRTVATGDVQVTLSWDVQSDLDLHVVEPSGEEIYWNNRVSATGGKLDLDSNAACNLDGVRNENAAWATTGSAPHGTYIVRIDMWTNCSTTASNYVLRVNNNGNATTYTGTLTGTGDQGGRGSGTVVATFTH